MPPLWRAAAWPPLSRRSPLRHAFIALILVAFVIPVAGQQPNLTQPVTIESKVLDENRNVVVRTPQSYAVGERKYPVIYMTDGERQLAHTAATIDFLTREGRMPEVIVVGITNTDRSRDLTPTHLAETTLDGQQFRFSTSGGADKFLVHRDRAGPVR